MKQRKCPIKHQCLTYGGNCGCEDCENSAMIEEYEAQTKQLKKSLEEAEAASKSGKQYGKILTGLVMREYIGDGAADGVKFELARAFNGAPIVSANGRHFVLSWQDICDLAEAAGLFNEGVQQ